MTIHIVSFGYLHGPAPEADFTIDARRLFRDPHTDPRFREMSGFDSPVFDRVMTTPGVEGTVANTAALLHILAVRLDTDITVAIGCAGGRHRSVAMARLIEMQLQAFHRNHVKVTHRDVHRPVVNR